MGRGSEGDRSGRPRGGGARSVGGRKPPPPALTARGAREDQPRARSPCEATGRLPRDSEPHAVDPARGSPRLLPRAHRPGRACDVRVAGFPRVGGTSSSGGPAPERADGRSARAPGSCSTRGSRSAPGSGAGRAMRRPRWWGSIALWKLKLAPGDLESIGAELGADVPFFVRGGTQLAEGKGDRLTRLPALPPLPVLIVSPALFIFRPHLSTGTEDWR